MCSMYKMSYNNAINDERDSNDGNLTPQRPPSYYGTGLDGQAAAAQDAAEYVQGLPPNRRGGGRRSKKRPTARRLRSSKARKARNARNARTTRRR